ncbi:unnamed protein product [Caenorhabditis auriculariae]|uniref:Choline/carnitine acyltransferase domain-containing protein n=1 Tax=Caenorhabditis auriculariae TaxID=2777116 RepID=A0A8S1GW30_9PELO|nr:unnamed protein product [Caenorhabditis auriculariae]
MLLSAARSVSVMRKSVVSSGSQVLLRTAQRDASDKSQTTLPRLPVPQPAKTLKHFLEFANAIESPKEFEETKKVVAEFAGNELPKLQQLLEQRAKEHQNWLTPWWLNVAYLMARTPLPVVTSPGVMFPKFDFDGLDGQLEHAAKITQAAVNFYLLASSGNLPPDMAGNVPFDMSQYNYLFGTTRIPRKSADIIKYGCDYGHTLQHIVVMRHGHVFRVKVLDDQKQPLSVSDIRKQLEQVVSQSEKEQSDPVGIISSDNRDKWATSYEILKENDSNKKNLEKIESALFALCLDKPSEPLPGYTERDEQSRQSLHGGGSKSNSTNRWFDKTIQFVIGSNGYCGMTYEHTPAEGPPVATMMDFICDKFDQAAFTDSGSAGSLDVERLDFNLDENVKTQIKKSSKKMDYVAQDLDVVAYTFKVYGKNLPKTAKVSPDSFIQLAFQLAFYRIHSSFPPTYETATLRKFVDGRTENIRSPNLAAVSFVKKMTSTPPAPIQDTFEALQHAANAHKKYTVDCMNAAGMDRHLLAWKLLASENNLPTPLLYGTHAYQQLMHFQVSTSQVPTRHFIQMCFGPSAPDCYGVCYNPQEKELHFCISTFKSYGSTSSKKFAKELERALMDMRSVVNKATKERSKL